MCDIIGFKDNFKPWVSNKRGLETVPGCPMIYTTRSGSMKLDYIYQFSILSGDFSR